MRRGRGCPRRLPPLLRPFPACGERAPRSSPRGGFPPLDRRGKRTLVIQSRVWGFLETGGPLLSAELRRGWLGAHADLDRVWMWPLHLFGRVLQPRRPCVRPGLAEVDWSRRQRRSRRPGLHPGQLVDVPGVPAECPKRSPAAELRSHFDWHHRTMCPPAEARRSYLDFVLHFV